MILQMMIDVYKKYKAIQFDSTNRKQLDEIVGKEVITCKLVEGDWLIYDLYLKQFGIWSDKTKQELFKTKEEL